MENQVTKLCDSTKRTLELYLVGGIPTPLQNDEVKVSWDDDIPN